MSRTDAPQGATHPRQPFWPQTLPEWLLELAAAGALLAQWVVVLTAWPELPDRVPQHFNAAGEADAWGSKAALLLMPLLNTAVCALMTFVSRFPHHSSLPIEVTSQNAPRVYRLVRFQTIWLKAIISFVLFYMSWRTIEQARGAAEGLGVAFLPLTVAAVGAAVAWFYLEIRRSTQPA